MTEIVAADIGGTHARFAIAEVENGRVTALGRACTLKTAEHASLQTAWEDFEKQIGRTLPQAAGIAVAGPVHGEVLKLTNNPWVIRPASVPATLGATRYSLINDLERGGHPVDKTLAHGSSRNRTNEKANDGKSFRPLTPSLVAVSWRTCL